LSREEQKAQTRAALLDAAERIFVERGFLGSSVEAISAAAGYTRGAFYSHFASKEELFAELLQERVYSIYGRIAQDAAEGRARPSARQLGEQLAAIQDLPDGRWLFRLWLELLAHASRDERFRAIAAGFWTANRALGAEAIRAAWAEAGKTPPVPPDRLATAMIAMDIGLALQHFVDPQAAPLDVYPQLFELLFGPVDPT
jgi:AcrR family transcriptional regulator